MIPLVQAFRRRSSSPTPSWAPVGRGVRQGGEGRRGTLQGALAAVVALGAAEHAVWFADYSAFNASGRRPVATTAVASLRASPGARWGGTSRWRWRWATA